MIGEEEAEQAEMGQINIRGEILIRLLLRPGPKQRSPLGRRVVLIQLKLMVKEWFLAQGPRLVLLLTI